LTDVPPFTLPASDCVPRFDPYLRRSICFEPVMAIASPCNKVCVIDPVCGLCAGCGRTLDEIARWTSLGEDGRAQVMTQLPQRLARMAKPRSAPADSM
jgi:predicted Fe-S protein YdhL (DUF1289 family)